LIILLWLIRLYFMPTVRDTLAKIAPTVHVRDVVTAAWLAHWASLLESAAEAGLPMLRSSNVFCNTVPVVVCGLFPLWDLAQ